MKTPFADRAEAGRLLAAALGQYRDRGDLLILALPRGGVPVAAEVAAALEAPLDLLLVRKLGLPAQPEVAIGAIASGGIQVMNPDMLGPYGITDETLDALVERENRELARREGAYRGKRPPPRLAGRCVVLIDDGLATGASMRAAVAAARAQNPREIVVAVPVAASGALESLREAVDALVCLAVPEPFFGVGNWYRSFPQTPDEEVRHLLAQAWQRDRNTEANENPSTRKESRS